MRSYEYFNDEERKNLIRIHYRLTNLVRRLTQGRRRCGGIGGGGGWLSFRDADVVRGNEEYEKGYEGEGEGVIIGTGKGVGG